MQFTFRYRETFALFVLLIFSSSILRLSAQQVLSGNLVTDRQFLATDGPYLIESHLVVNPEVTVIFEAGCVIEFQENASLQVRGNIIAVGTLQEPVRFKSANAQSSWAGIKLIECTNSIIKHCIIEGALEGVLVSDSFGNDFPSISNNEIINCGTGIVTRPRWGKAFISENLIKDCTTGVFSDFGQPIIQRNVIVNSKSIGIRVQEGTCGGGGYCGSSPSIEGNTIVDSGYRAILLINTKALVSNNTIIGARGPLIQISKFEPTLVGNSLHNYSNSFSVSIASGTGILNSNYWGTTSINDTQILIEDINDNYNYGWANIEDILLFPDEKSPVSPPRSVTKNFKNGSTLIEWSPNPEPSVAGYRIYEYEKSINHYSFLIEIADGHSAKLPETSFNSEIFVTAFTEDADDKNDLFEGHESWYSQAYFPSHGVSLSSDPDLAGNVLGSGNYLHGSTATIEAIPNAGYLFANWSGSITGTANPRQFLVEEPQNIQAVFIADMADHDEDGLSNYDEVVTHGTNPDLADTDGDGITDGDEIVGLLDPLVDNLATIEMLQNNPSYLSNLYTQVEYNQNFQNGVEYVLNDVSRYNLYDQETYNENYQRGIDEVLGSPSEYSLFTEAQLKESYKIGLDYVIENPSEFSLYTPDQVAGIDFDGLAVGVDGNGTFRLRFAVRTTNDFNTWNAHTLEEGEVSLVNGEVEIQFAPEELGSSFLKVEGVR